MLGQTINDSNRETFTPLNNALYTGLFDKIPELLCVMDRNRNIVFANKAFRESISLKSVEILGRKLGDVYNCNAIREDSDGCGTNEQCAYCGAFLSITSALNGKEKKSECNILQKNSGDALIYKVTASPLNIDKDEFILFVLTDISDNKRREMLERVFFHDILNTASGINSFAELMEMELPSEFEEYKNILKNSSQKLINEIQAQKMLLNAENGNLALNIAKFNSNQFLNEAVNFSRHFNFENNVSVLLDQNSAELNINSDYTILGRIITNLLKNAIEAEYPDGEVIIGLEELDDNIRFYVQNNTFMPRKIQLQMFKKSFSTKGSDRGIGTYSIKLFTEKYLKGKVYFESSEDNGTTFFVELAK